LPWGDSRKRVIALGDRSHVPRSWLGELLPHFAVRMLEAPRRADPRRYGVPTDPGDWYVEGSEGPDPHAFHLSLVALEALVAEAPGVSLVGIGQGAVLCLSLACCWPERLSAVVACEGGLPAFPPGGLEERPLAGLPLLCVGRATGSTHALEGRGARVYERDAWDAAATAAWLSEVTRGPRHVAC